MIVLYMLKRCDVPLSKAQIYDFILEKEYTTFLTLQEVFSELASQNLISEKTVGNRTFLEITEEGTQALEFFGNRINPSIRKQTDEYLSANNIKFRNESSILGDYRKTGENEYTITLTAKENGQNLIELRITVPTEEMAQSMVENWKTKNQDIYQYVFTQLISQ